MKKKQFSIKDLLIGAVLGGLITGSIVLLVTANAPQGEVSKETEKAEEYADLLQKNDRYALPVGAAEISAYYTTIEKETTLDRSEPVVTCSALAIVDGPEILMEALKNEKYGTPPKIVIGPENANWGKINDSSEKNPIKLLVTLDSAFEGEAIGCMPTVLSDFTVVE